MVELTILQRVVDKGHTAKFLPQGEYGKLEKRLSEIVDPETGVVLYYAFDYRTRAGPFVGADMRMPNCGIRTVGAAFHQAGFDTRVVLGNWNNNFNFRYAKLNGNIPEVFGVGSMQIHEADAHSKIEQAASMVDKRPLIIGGGPHANYQAWDFFDRDPRRSVDVAVRGENNVTLKLMETIMEHKGRNQTMLQGFEEARRSGALDSVSGITYISEDREVLIDTGLPELIADVDEFPMETIGLGLIEPRINKKRDLSKGPIPLDKLMEYGVDTVSIFSSSGCGLRCEYCPIPEQAQFTERAKSPERMVAEHTDILLKINPRFVFWSDDNLFTFRRQYQEALHGALASAVVNEKPLGRQVIYGTEATEAQAFLYRDLFPLMAEGGLSAVWFGIEDLTQKLVKKGQSESKTIEVFKGLRENGISPMPMMMHFQGQPLRGEKGKLDGILDQVNFLRKQGAATMQVTYNSPSIGSKHYGPEHFDKGTVLSKAGDLVVEFYLFDGNHVVSTPEENKLERQDNLLACYESFYNLGNLGRAALEVVRTRFSGDRNAKNLANFAFGAQLGARKGLRISKKNLREWREALATGRFEYVQEVPKSAIPIVQASEIAYYNSVTGLALKSVGYETHVASLYERFVERAHEIYSRSEHNVHESLESISRWGRNVVAEAEKRYEKMHEDLRSGAEKALENLRERVYVEIEKYRERVAAK